MEKLRKYNQLVLAIGGTITLIILIIAGIIGLQDLFRTSYYHDDLGYEPGIIAEELADSLVRKNERDQIITFNNFQLIDSARQIYLLPVSQRNLEETESTTNGLINLSNNFSGSGNYDSKRYKSGLHYNNLIVYDASKDSSRIIFDQRLSISNFQYLTLQDKRYLLIRAAKNDSNKDAYVDQYDLQRLFIYALDSDKLRAIEIQDSLSFLSFTTYLGDQQLALLFGADRNQNGEFEYDSEPKLYFRLDLGTNILSPVVSKLQINKLQHLLEGREE